MGSKIGFIEIIKNGRTSIVCIMLIASFCACDSKDNQPAASSDVPEGYKLVWSDEFNVDGLPDSDKWSFDTEANETGWYNNELQYYGDGRMENSKVSDGKLMIIARKEALTSADDYGGQDYTSARLITQGKASWTYGFIEVRAKLPCGVGTWPAIWLLGDSDIPWPASGEIDMMEQVGSQPDEITGTIHTTSTAGTSGDGNLTIMDDVCEVFHNYQLTWTAEQLTLAVDGKPFHTYKNKGTGTDSWPFDKPFYLLLNLAIGGDMAGPIVDDTIFPVQMEIDYVRIYQK
jgi:beta-glucanase (GH16 family)